MAYGQMTKKEMNRKAFWVAAKYFVIGCGGMLSVGVVWWSLMSGRGVALEGMVQSLKEMASMGGGMFVAVPLGMVFYVAVIFMLEKGSHTGGRNKDNEW